MRLPYYSILFFGFLALCLPPHLVLSQDDLVQVDTSALEKPEAFPVIDLSDRLENVNEDYEIIQARLSGGVKILSLDTQLLNFENQLEGEYQQYQRFRRVSPNRQ